MKRIEESQVPERLAAESGVFGYLKRLASKVILSAHAGNSSSNNNRLMRLSDIRSVLLGEGSSLSEGPICDDAEEAEKLLSSLFEGGYLIRIEEY